MSEIEIFDENSAGATFVITFGATFVIKCDICDHFSATFVIKCDICDHFSATFVIKCDFCDHFSATFVIKCDSATFVITTQ